MLAPRVQLYDCRDSTDFVTSSKSQIFGCPSSVSRIFAFGSGQTEGLEKETDADEKETDVELESPNGAVVECLQQRSPSTQLHFDVQMVLKDSIYEGTHVADPVGVEPDDVGVVWETTEQFDLLQLLAVLHLLDSLHCVQSPVACPESLECDRRWTTDEHL